MIEERIYPTYKIATLNQVLLRQGVSPDKLLEGTALLPEEILSNSTRISKQQLIQIYHNSVAITLDSAIGLQVGQRLGMTNYGIYGYALISSATLREALVFSMKYHQMATPTVRMSLIDEPDKDQAAFRFHDLIRIDALYSFNIELQFSLVFSLFKGFRQVNFLLDAKIWRLRSSNHPTPFSERTRPKISIMLRPN